MYFILIHAIKMKKINILSCILNVHKRNKFIYLSYTLFYSSFKYLLSSEASESPEKSRFSNLL